MTFGVGQGLHEPAVAPRRAQDGNNHPHNKHVEMKLEKERSSSDRQHVTDHELDWVSVFAGEADGLMELMVEFVNSLIEERDVKGPMRPVEKEIRDQIGYDKLRNELTQTGDRR